MVPSFPMKKIHEIFLTLGNKFGFQDDNVSNMYDHFMTLLDSRSSRMSCPNALLSLHLDYIGGKNSNYKKWYFSAQWYFEHEWSPKMKKRKAISSDYQLWLYHFQKIHRRRLCLSGCTIFVDMG